MMFRTVEEEEEEEEEDVLESVYELLYRTLPYCITLYRRKFD